MMYRLGSKEGSRLMLLTWEFEYSGRGLEMVLGF